MRGLAAWLPSGESTPATFAERTRTLPDGTVERWSDELEQAQRTMLRRLSEQLYQEEMGGPAPLPIPLRYRVRWWLLAKTVRLRRVIVEALGGTLYEDQDG